MPKNIIIFDSGENSSVLFDFFTELKGDNDKLYFFIRNFERFKKDRDSGWPVKKFILYPLAVNNIFSLIIFFLLWPVYFMIFFLLLVRYKKKKHIKTVICMNWPEKILITPVARALDLKTVWIEVPGSVYSKTGLKSRVFRLCSQWAQLTVLSEFTRQQLLEIGVDPQLIKYIRPGIKLENYGLQDNIFNKIAEVEHRKINRKFFSLGTVIQPSVRTIIPASGPFSLRASSTAFCRSGTGLIKIFFHRSSSRSLQARTSAHRLISAIFPAL